MSMGSSHFFTELYKFDISVELHAALKKQRTVIYSVPASGNIF